MAIKFKVKRGLKTNLPQLDEGEIGLVTNERRLYFGTNYGGPMNMRVANVNDIEDLEIKYGSTNNNPIAVFAGGTGGKTRTEAWNNLVAGGGTFTGTIFVPTLVSGAGTFTGNITVPASVNFDNASNSFISSDISSGARVVAGAGADANNATYLRVNSPQVDSNVKGALTIRRDVSGAPSYYNVHHTGCTRSGTYTRPSDTWASDTTYSGMVQTFGYTFSSVPVVVVSTNVPGFVITIDSITTTQFTYSIRNATNVETTRSVAIYYIATNA